MGEIFTTLQANWAVIQQAPWIFGIWTVVVVSAAWAFVSHLKANTIETLEARLRLRDDRISEYERKLPAASPDQARALFDALEKKIEAMKPKAVQRNPNNLYQLGEAVATVEGAQVAKDEGRVFFQAVRHNGALNPVLPVEYQDLVLDLGIPAPDWQGPPSVVGLKVSMIVGLSARIIGSAKS